MTIKELQEIIDLNADAAESGSLQAQGQVIEAQAEIERLEAEDPFAVRHAAMVAQAEADQAFWNEQEQVEDDMTEEQWRSEERNWGVEEEGA
jgi:hypothetical protein|tara:strand:- start:198 stop:473 length:276 start_codon:yes stop_codon:yes gene_type:complete